MKKENYHKSVKGKKINIITSLVDLFVVVYLDNIVVYSGTLEEHVEHLRAIFQILHDNQLYVKKEKCSFAQEVLFLGHWITSSWTSPITYFSF